MTHTNGKLVRLESGGWAQYRQVEVQGPSPVTMLIAVELTEAEVLELMPKDASPLETLH